MTIRAGGPGAPVIPLATIAPDGRLTQIAELSGRALAGRERIAQLHRHGILGIQMRVTD
jgi:hypothetical protein